MFSLCLFVSTITRINSTDFHKIRSKGVTWTKKETMRFWW